MQSRLDIILETVSQILSESRMEKKEMKSSRDQPRSSEKHIETLVTGAKKQGRSLTGSEKAAIERHRQNIITREKKTKK